MTLARDSISTIRCDVVIVGGGAAGCILAARLSERPNVSVVLIEAGIDTPPGATPANILDIYPSSQGDPSYYWPDLNADLGKPTAQQGDRPFWAFAQARVLGGGSSVMGMMALRGLPADYDAWRDAGCDGWGWEDVLPHFRRVERDLDFEGPLHGHEGPIPIRRVTRPSWPGFLNAAANALEASGHRAVDDLNGLTPIGFGPVPKSCTPEHRVSSASGYLTASVRKRPNLRIITQAFVEGLLFAGDRASGVAIGAPQNMQVLANEVILSCGAIYSPALLMRAGLGPRSQIEAAGLAVRHDLPGVGQNLQNHPILTLTTHLRPRMRQPGRTREICGLWNRYSSDEDGCPVGDMALFVLGATAPHPVAASLGGVGVTVWKAFSKGEVRLVGGKPHTPPQVRFNLLQDPRDLTRMVRGLQKCLDLLDQPGPRAARNEVFFPDPILARRFGGSGLRPQLESWLARAVFESATVRRRMLAPTALDPGRLSEDVDAVRELVLQRTGVTGHVVGTCRMGSPSDLDAVVDSRCRVRGVDGLRVIDASIMPTIVSANTSLTVQMIAERAADFIQAERR